MKTFHFVIVTLLIFSVISSCNGTLNTFLRYFGFKITPIEDVEFVTEKIIESTRMPKIRLQTRMPRKKIEEQKEMIVTTKKPEITTEKPISTTFKESLYEKLPKELVDAAALNLDAMIEALSIMKAPVANSTSDSQFLIKVEPLKSEKLIEGSEDDTTEMTTMMSMSMMELMQPPMMEAKDEKKLANAMEYLPPPVELPQYPLPLPPVVNIPPLPLPTFPLPIQIPGNNIEVIRSKEIFLPTNEIVIGSSINVADYNTFPQNLMPPSQFLYTAQSYPYYKK